jgi:hypothetical protein
MSFELSQPVKIVAIVALLVAAGAMGLFLLNEERSSSKSPPVQTAPAQVRAPARTHPATARHAAPAAPKLVSGIPAPLAGVLRHSKLVVAVVFAKGDPVAADVLAQARAGARAAHAPLVVLNVAKDGVARQTAGWMNSNIVEPAVLVVERPGTISVELDGYTDQTAVAQAVIDARR